MRRREFFAAAAAFFVAPKLPTSGVEIARRARPALTINRLPPFLVARIDKAHEDALLHSLTEGRGYIRIMREKQDRGIEFLTGGAWPT